MPSAEPKLNSFLEDWPQEQIPLKKHLLQLKDHALAQDKAKMEFVARPGVSHSLRFDLEPRPQGRKRPVFCLVDVVQVSGEAFLSVCFYQDEISDPAELGNAIPQGLFEEDGYCFDLEQDDPELAAYLNDRISEAHGAATASADA